MPSDTGTALETRLVRVRGRVQGVGYRHACVQQARALGIAGWVRNRSDGSVEALLQGSSQELAVMCKFMHDGVDSAIVEDMHISGLPPPFARYDRFEQRPTE